MQMIKILLNDQGEVVGTTRSNGRHPTGHGGQGPQATPVARAGQRVIEVSLDDAIASLPPAELHAALKAKHVH